MGIASAAESARAVSQKRQQEQKFIYYVEPQSAFCNQAIAEYLGDMASADESRQLLCLGNEVSIFVWRVSLGFLKQLDDRRRQDPRVFAFRAFRHPTGDRSSIKPYHIGGMLDADPIVRQVKRDLGRMIGIHPKVGKKRKR